MGERDDYKFLKIKDAISAINQKVNLIGVVIELGFPKTTRGTGTATFFFFTKSPYSVFLHLIKKKLILSGDDDNKGRTYGRYQKIIVFMVGGRLMNFSS